MSALIVLPAAERDLWLTRMLRYATEHGIEVGGVLTVADEAEAVREILAMFAEGAVDRLLIAVREHLPMPWPITVASDPGPDAAPRFRRPRVIDHGGEVGADGMRRPVAQERPRPDADHPWRSR